MTRIAATVTLPGHHDLRFLWFLITAGTVPL